MPSMVSPEGSVTIKLNGVPAPSIEASLRRVVVESSLHMPGMVELHVVDQKVKPQAPVFEHVDSSTLQIGNTIAVSFSGYGPRAFMQPAFKGDIIALEPSFDSQGARMIVRGYDALYRLHLGTKTQVHKGTESQIVQQVLSDRGIPGTPPASMSQFHKWLLQYNSTDFAFISWLLHRSGHYMWLNPLGMLRFLRVGVPPAETNTVEWGRDLISFYPRASLMQQIGKVRVVGTNTEQGRDMQANALLTPDSSGGIKLMADRAAAHKKVSGETFVIHDDLASDASAAAKVAISQVSLRQVQFTEAEGECLGNPNIQAGTLLTVLGTGLRFSGSYLVTATRHVWDAQNGYRTFFKASLGTPDVLAALLCMPIHQEPKIPGLLVATVTNNTDPLGLGRVKVRLSWLDPQCETDFCPVLNPMGGKQRGLQNIPEVGDTVVVAFENGSPERPVVMGAVWNNKQPPPLAKDAVVGGKVVKRIWKSTAGHQILLDDTSGKECIQICDKSGKNLIQIDSAENKLILSVQGDCAINAEQTVQVTAKQTIALKNANGNVEIECVNFRVKANGECKLEGATAEVKSKGSTTVEGSTLTLTGKTVTSVDGNPVQINKQSLVVMP